MKNKDNNKMGYTHYGSFAEVAADFKCKPVRRRTNDKKKLEKQQNQFLSHHLCRSCKSPMTLIKDTNIFVCKNPDCQGIDITRKDDNGNEISKIVLPSYDLLDEESAMIANNIF